MSRQATQARTQMVRMTDASGWRRYNGCDKARLPVFGFSFNIFYLVLFRYRSPMRRTLTFLLLVCSALDIVAAPVVKPAVVDLNTPREFPVITNRAQWEERARNIREQILVSSGLWPMPEKTPLRAHVFGKIVRDGYS